MTTTRRTFLKVVGAGALATGALPGCGYTGPMPAGNVADVPEGEVVAVKDGLAPVFIGRDAGGIYAMTAICTHLGCDITDEGGDINVDRKRITCGEPCGHGSVYDFQGAVLLDPATAPLKHWRTSVDDDGEITVQVGTEAAPGQRTAVA